ncbi:MAG: RNA-binding protein [Thermoprotei archaeon]|nr:MAG: RNA-binding protein [Thermoprotei archaeon]RLF20898.1 MAG: RNA-binding protein [Thermoprotei archaeon]
MARSSEEIISSLDKAKIISLLKRGVRLDERRLDEVRPITVETGVVQKAEGSALVKLGNTISIAGVKAEIGTPFSDTPNEGVLIVNAEFLPLASPSFEPGPPDENAIEVARVVDRGIRSSRAVSLEDLAIIPGKKVWIIYVDVYVLNHDGNMIDASSLATIAALLDTKIPKVKVIDGENIEILDEWVPLPVRDRPVSVTIAKINDTLIVDPGLEEENIMDCRLTLTVNEKGEICAIQKGIGGSLTLEEVYRAIDLAEKAAKKIREALPPLPNLENVEWVVREEKEEKE